MSGIRRVILAAIIGVCITCVCSLPSGLASGQPVSPQAGEKNLTLSPPKIGGAGGFSQPRRYEYAGTAHASTSTTTTQRWQDFALGKVVKVGATNYVKVADDQWLAMANPLCNDPVLLYPGSSKSFSYTGDAQSYTFYKNCQYRVELWGASGGTGAGNYTGGKGAYVAGSLDLNNETLYLYVGATGNDAPHDHTESNAAESRYGGWNGGGGINGTTEYGTKSWSDYQWNTGTGGGATDVRLVSSDLTKDTTYYAYQGTVNSSISRIMVAAGGGGGDYQGDGYGYGGPGGGISSDNAKNLKNTTYAMGSNQVTAGTSAGGCGYNGIVHTTEYINKTFPHLYFIFGKFSNGGAGGHGAHGGGGGGWYGGTSGYGCGGPGSGGSSYISGHTGCVAVTSTSDSSPKPGCTTGTTDNSCSISPYGYTFTDTVMIDGAGYAWTNVKGALQPMPNPAGGYYVSGVGHTGNGAARITRLN